MEENRYDSRELLRPIVARYVEAHLASHRYERGFSVWMSIKVIIDAPFASAWMAWDTRNYEKDGDGKYNFRELSRLWLASTLALGGVGWHSLIHPVMSDEEWQEYLEEEVRMATLEVWEGWLLFLCRAGQDAGMLKVNHDTMLPRGDLEAEMVNAFNTMLHDRYGIGLKEFQEILKEVRGRLPDDRLLPDDMVEYFLEFKHVTVVSE